MNRCVARVVVASVGRRGESSAERSCSTAGILLIFNGRRRRQQN